MFVANKFVSFFLYWRGKLSKQLEEGVVVVKLTTPLCGREREGVFAVHQTDRCTLRKDAM